MNRLLDRPRLVFALVFAWKVALLVFTAQPIPANDAFFYDGPVVHLLNHGGYYNPTIELARPISGREVFSAYPPLYQLVLLGWMSVFGTSAISAMWLHMVLFGCYLLTVLAIFRRLGVPAICSNLAGLFLLAITFQDRPDSVAIVTGTLAIYCWVRAQPGWKGGPSGSRAWLWSWNTSGFVILTLSASLQIGAVYFGLILLVTVVGWRILRTPLPLVHLAAMLLIPMALIALVRFGFPRLWAGFIENVHDNPSLTGLRVPAAADLLKIGRNLAGLIIIAGLVLWKWRQGDKRLREGFGAREILLGSGLVVALSLVGGCATVVTTNWITSALYIQPLLVGLFLAVLDAWYPGLVKSTKAVVWVAMPAGLAAIRAVGMSTWGVACAADVSYARAIQRVGAELEGMPRGKMAILSAPFLYEASRHTNGMWIHEDYPLPPKSSESFATALRQLRAPKLVLSQFDYYRRYEPILAELRQEGGVEIKVSDVARIRSPDSYRRLRQVLQHISWSPVIVDLEWK